MSYNVAYPELGLHSILYWTRDIDKLAKSQLSLAKQIEQGT